MRPVLPLALLTGLLSGLAGGFVAADHYGGARVESQSESGVLSPPSDLASVPAPDGEEPRSHARNPEGLPDPAAPTAAPESSGTPISRRSPATRENAADEGTAGAPKSPPPALGALLPELEALLAEGALGPDLEGRRTELSKLLVNTWLDLQQPHRALELLRDGPQDRGSARRVARALKEVGDTAAGFEALSLAFRNRPYDFSLANEMAGYEPEAALALADSLWSDAGVSSTLPVRAARARMLAKAERRDEALELTRSLIAEDPSHTDAWDLLGQLDPEGTIESLREEALPGGDMRLAELLVENDRPEEALPILEASFQTGDAPSQALGKLLELEPERALALLDASQDVPVDNWVYQNIGDALFAAERTDEAVDAWYRYFDETPWDRETNNALREHDPDGFWRRFRAKAEADQDDEVWGDLADEYWHAGERELAKQAWQRAHGMDPGDGEWTGKLESLALDRDPL